MLWINFIVALTNLTGLYYIVYKKLTMIQILIISCPMCASLIYHLAETKHNLLGLYPINKYSSQLLWIDRFFAVCSVCIVLLYLIKNHNNLNQIVKNIIIGILGLLCLLISERDIIYKKMDIYHDYVMNQYEYLFFHSLWHIFAFVLLGSIVQKIFFY